MIKKILLSLLVIVIVFCAVLVIKTFTFSFKQPKYAAIEGVSVPNTAIERFQKSITFKTISYLESEKLDSAEFQGFHDFLAASYPLTDSVLDKKFFNYSVLYTWQGTDRDLPAVVMMGHLDVVPVDESTMDKWDADPFSGKLIGERIIGRGTMDDKINVMALMEASEMLIANGFQPSRTIHFSFGHDEEVGGDNGAKLVAEYLKSTGQEIAFAIDEGGYLAERFVPGLNKTLAVINTGEKGYVSYKLTINTPGGHSSQPPADNTIGSLARAITKLENNQFEYRWLPVMLEQFDKVGPAFPGFMERMAFANKWLFGEYLLKGYNAHTTTAPTMITGGVKDNVIPTEASVVVNFRIMPGETVEDVEKHIISTVDDERIKLETISNVNEPSPVSDSNSDSYKLIEKTVLELFPDVIVTPGLLGAGTDSKHFIGVAENVYRFYPTRLNPENATGFHGNNEFCTVSNYKEVVQFNYRLIENLNQPMKVALSDGLIGKELGQ